MTVESVTGSGELYWDPYDFDLHANPHPVWRRMREEAPLYRNDKYDFWALTRFDDVMNVLVDSKTYTINEGDLLESIRTPKNRAQKVHRTCSTKATPKTCDRCWSWIRLDMTCTAICSAGHLRPGR